MIKQLEVAAFKGFKSFVMKPKNVNLLIGANGTGKTNFADLLDFLSLTCRIGLKGAFEKYGSLDEVRRMVPGAGRIPVLRSSIELGV